MLEMGSLELGRVGEQFVIGHQTCNPTPAAICQQVQDEQPQIVEHTQADDPDWFVRKNSRL